MFRNILDQGHAGESTSNAAAQHAKAFKKDTCETCGNGLAYIYNNTMVQENGDCSNCLHGADQGVTLGGSRNLTAKNNLLDTWQGTGASIHPIDDATNQLNNYDYDMYDGSIPAWAEPNGFNEEPTYDAGNEAMEWYIDPNSTAFESGLWMCDGIMPNTSVDLGAFQTGQNLPRHSWNKRKFQSSYGMNLSVRRMPGQPGSSWVSPVKNAAATRIPWQLS